MLMLKNTGFADALKVRLNWARALQEETSPPRSLSGEGFDEDECVETVSVVNCSSYLADQPKESFASQSR